jgi:hypothetical protein
MRVAVIFFGVARGVPVTIGSIRRNVYACNPGDEFSFHTVASLNLVDSIRNPRTGEDGAALNAADAFLLNADVYALVRQDDAAIAGALAAARRHGDYFRNDWISIRNAFHQLAALQRAWNLLEVLHGETDYFLFLRPDLIYHDQIRLKNIVRKFRGSGNIALPAWHGWGGFNDRFALADPAAARHYAARLSLVPDYCAERQFHPESFLAFALEKGECSICELPVKASRVRAHGVIETEDFGLAATNLPSAPKRFTNHGGQVCFGGRYRALVRRAQNLTFWRKAVKKTFLSG